MVDRCRFSRDKEVYDGNEGEEIKKPICLLVAYDQVEPFECDGLDPSCRCYSPIILM
ncbi:hypothetical protein LCGC14_2192300 [marine sediment metagenome]|uniref:Uncharacterized protein n=1 Tax=marine sediment metagenome TaxID=412755 RepID=A0A0F9DJ95_9ZZZZ